MPAKRVAKKTTSVKKTKAAKRPAKTAVPRVDASMNVMDIIALHPGAAEVMSAYGLHCVGCAFNTLDSLGDGAKSHGLTDHDVNMIVADLNELLASSKPRPSTLTITADAARALLKVAEGEDKKGYGLRVDTDERGAFCMEFEKEAKKDDLKFRNAEVPELTFFASPLTLWRIGGSTIDYREGRFKLDMASEPCGCGKTTCGCGGSCGKN